MVFRSLLLILNTALIFYIYNRENYRVTTATLIVALIIQVYLMVLKEKREQKRVISYLESLVEDGTNISPRSKKSFSYSIKTVLDEIISKYNLTKLENKESDDLIRALLNHINIGLITYSSDGEVDLINRSARQLLSINHLTNIGDRSSIKSGDRKLLLDFNKDINSNIELQNGKTLYIQSSNITLMEESLRIISLQNLSRAMDIKEMDSWNTLIRSLNHEIMNSITPISSLAGSARTLLDENSNPNLVDAVETIERRSRNLLAFVKNYKNLSQIPKPKRRVVNVEEFINNILTLMSSFARENKTKLLKKIESDELMLYVDLGQLEQIVINLIKNSIEASSTEVILKSKIDIDGKVVIAIEDNGEGFSKESKTKAFVPFYTTKPKGSGLGLSIVRQIMHLHSGRVELKQGESGSTISLLFP